MPSIGTYPGRADDTTPLPVTVTSGGGSGGLTNTELRATPVPVSGPLTDTQLRASAVPVAVSSVTGLDKGAGNTSATTLRVVTAADGPLNTAIGGTSDAAVTDPTATASIVAALKGLLTLNKISTAGGQGSKAVTTAATPLALAASTACTQIIITARIGNTKQIAYGFSNAVRATAGSEIGAQLQPGDSVSLKVNNLSSIFIDAQVNGEGVSYTYMTD